MFLSRKSLNLHLVATNLGVLSGGRGGAVYFDLSFLVGKAFNLIIYMDFKNKKHEQKTSVIVF